MNISFKFHLMLLESFSLNSTLYGEMLHNAWRMEAASQFGDGEKDVGWSGDGEHCLEVEMNAGLAFGSFPGF